MSEVLARWNNLSHEDAASEILPCCGSRAWAERMAARRPVSDESSLLAVSDEAWSNLNLSDWLEAFRSHPRIGESSAAPSATAKSSAWSAREQQKVAAANDSVKAALAAANREYEQRFERIFLVCASGKAAEEILEILRRRLHNSDDAELQEAAEQQRQITQIRLKKWLGE
jgi:2-oxo-4-hydroxy-4-carboxy-5-ureidoimidazoline decarboxylase